MIFALRVDSAPLQAERARLDRNTVSERVHQTRCTCTVLKTIIGEWHGQALKIINIEGSHYLRGPIFHYIWVPLPVWRIH